MTTPKYTYKGTDITNLISGSTNTSLTNYEGFPSYDSASTYSTERPLPLNFLQSGVDISTKMNAEFIDLTTGTDVEYTIPSDYTTLRAILEGGGGGGGGDGGCGYNINSGDGPIGRNPGSSGGTGGNGLFLYVSDVSGISSFQYSVGTGGAGGGDGNNGGDSNNSGQGNDGQQGQTGNESIITFVSSGTTYNIVAGGGNGGPSGRGGNTTPTSSVNPSRAAINTPTTYAGPVANVLSMNINPLGYLTNISGAGSKNTTGDPGYIRVYLLKN
jgi:hypothetical protein